ncbi:MAG: PD40 domain-containing protein [Acidobacteria bacterium]|nr:PD40 domain-containing protein [Acidobacteriota bacterium]
MRKIIAASILIIFSSLSMFSGDNKLTYLSGPYLGQKPPGDVPVLFAPGIVTDIFREHSAALFTPDGKELFWTRVINQGLEDRVDVVMHMKLVNGKWTEPELAPFNIFPGTHIDCISPDGKRIYFRTRYYNEKTDSIDYGKWIVEKNDGGWGEPHKNELKIDWGKKMYLIQEARNGNIYFQSELENVESKIGFYVSKFVDGKYQKPVALDENINSKYMDYAFFVDPDEEFIIFSSKRPGGFEQTDLYISYRNSDGSWSEAINLGKKINTAGDGVSNWAQVSPDKKYLFFTTLKLPFKDIENKNYTFSEMRKKALSFENGHGKIYWVNADIINKLKSQND